MKKKSVNLALDLEQNAHPPSVAQPAEIELQGSLADLIYDLLGSELEPELGGGTSPGDISATPVWYLGLDIGTTALSAVLLDRAQRQLYPLYWTRTSASISGLGDRRFRLPLVAGSPASAPPDSIESPHRVYTPWKIPLAKENILPTDATNPADAPVWQLHRLKPYLGLGTPDVTLDLNRQDGLIQWSDNEQVPLLALRQVLQTALSSLTAEPSIDLGLSCGALELDAAALRSALRQLAGIVVSSPINSSEAYRFNLRQVILQLGLVTQPEQIVFVEEPIAALFSLLRQEGSTTVVAEDGTQEDLVKENSVLHHLDWQGNTLILSAGATLTELAIVQLPPQIQDLSSADFQTRSLSYAGNSIDQDIICQILIPLLQQPVSEDTRLARGEKAHLHLNPVHLDRLDLSSLTLPVPGEPDLVARYRLQQRLESCQSGQILQEAAHYLKLALQQQNQLILQVGDRIGTILRQDLGSEVILPYVQKLNRELNTLLKQTQTPVSSVQQILCTGGTASIAAIARWLRQKFPNATILQDTYTRPIALYDHSFASCSRVAYGLAVLPLYAQLLNTIPQQNGAYWLLAALLQHFPAHPITVDEGIEILQRQGIDGGACRSQLLDLLEGHLPPGLLPTEAEAILLAPSLPQPQPPESLAAPLFHQQDDRYGVNPLLQAIVLHRLETLLLLAPSPLAVRSISDNFGF